MVTVLLDTYSIISQICPHIRDIIITSLATEMSFHKITKVFNQKCYKVY